MLLWLAWMEGGRVVGSLLHTYPHSFLPLKSSWVSLAGRQGGRKGLLLVIDGHLLTGTTGNSPSFLESTLLEVEML